jgi:Excalibur calcium-binding domain
MAYRTPRWAWLALFAALTLALLASGAVSRAAADANCSDFSTQAAAQAYFLAHGGPAQDPDRLDADHDGVACESLPCPCDHGTASAPTPRPVASPTPTPTPRSAGSLGTSVTLAPVRRASDCHLRGPLPDRRCTPGARLSKATKTDVCTPGYSSRVRNVSQSLKNAVYAEYDLTTHFNGRTGEVDHLVSLELGGSNAEANLFPEAALPHPGSKDKDRLENKLHALVCKGRLALATAQRAIARDWVAAYRMYVGPVPTP